MATGAGDPRKTSRWQRLRRQILSENDICWLCGHPGADTVDHVTAIRKGGEAFDLANLRPAHLTCNSRKRDRDVRPNHTSRLW
jgi:5-methylcytosine-specific restriction endonuclease McrA